MERFCVEMRKHGRPGVAAASVGCSKRAVQIKRKADPEFDAMCREAWEAFQEETIGKVQEYAWQGKQEPIIEKGAIVGVKTLYFPRLVELEARRVVPEYRERHHLELSGNPERPVAVDLSGLSDEDLLALRAIQGRTKPRGKG
jgi:hypothetical protein